MKIALVPGLKLDVAPLRAALEARPHLWDRIPIRTGSPDSPHRELSDIWVRYVSVQDAPRNQPAPFVWHLGPDELPEVMPLIHKVMNHVGAARLGGVLITRIPPGATCHPHADRGWHAESYEKYAVQVASAPGQAFCFEGESLSAEPGECYWFDNAHTHWVTNPTTEARVTLIVCTQA